MWRKNDRNEGFRVLAVVKACAKFTDDRNAPRNSNIETYLSLVQRQQSAPGCLKFCAVKRSPLAAREAADRIASGPSKNPIYSG